ncbi:unnamed protein product [Aphanomyces euteiches]
MPSDRLNGVAPVTAFTGLPAMTPLSAFVNPITKEHMAELHEAMNQLHRDLASTSAKKRLQARERQAKKKAVQLQNCLCYRVVTDYVMETQELVSPCDLSLHHACRLKLYCEGGRDVTEDLADHIAFGHKGFHVARLWSVRVENGEYQALVYWLGLNEEEASWEPVQCLYEDIPVAFRRSVNQSQDEEVKKMAEAHEKSLGHSL